MTQAANGGHDPGRDIRAAPVYATTADMLQAAVYLRQSLDKSGEGAAVERQRTDALQLAKLRGWEIVRIEADNDTSAAGKRRRPHFEAVLTAIENGEVGSRDRLGHDPTHPQPA